MNEIVHTISKTKFCSFTFSFWFFAHTQLEVLVRRCELAGCKWERVLSALGTLDVKWKEDTAKGEACFSVGTLSDYLEWQKVIKTKKKKKTYHITTMMHPCIMHTSCTYRTSCTQHTHIICITHNSLTPYTAHTHTSHTPYTSHTSHITHHTSHTSCLITHITHTLDVYDTQSEIMSIALLRLFEKREWAVLVCVLNEITSLLLLQSKYVQWTMEVCTVMCVGE